MHYRLSIVLVWGLLWGSGVAAQSVFHLVTPVLGPTRLPNGSVSTEFDEGYIALGPPGFKAMLVLDPKTELYAIIKQHQGQRLILRFEFEEVK